MPNFGMAEVFGIRTGDVSAASWSARSSQLCPFDGVLCVKRPSGVCSIEDGSQVAITCPRRFRERQIVYREAAAAIFGGGSDFKVLGEVPFLRPVRGSGRAVGNIDNIIVRVHQGNATDWAALEVQAVYFSGAEIETESQEYFRTGRPVVAGRRRPDFRSCSAKRLLPQLEVKVPILSRWGKKMVVVVDEPFFAALPTMTTANDLSNADIVWLVYGLAVQDGAHYKLELQRQVLTTLDETRAALVGGVAPPRTEFEGELARRITAAHGLPARF